MPRLYHGNSFRSWISSIVSPLWWRRKRSKFSSGININNNKGDDTTTTGATTRDWRSLSPNDPPLPFVSGNDLDGPNADSNKHTQASERSPKRTPILNRYRQSLNDDPPQKLSTIIEESDLVTEISVSPRSSNSHHHYYHYHRQQLQQQQQQHELPTHSGTAISISLDRLNSDKNKDIIVVPLPPLPINEPSHPSSTTTSTSGTSSSTSSSSSSSSSSSTNSFQPPPAWPIHPKTERRWSATPSPIPTNEKKAKRKFAKMVQAALKFRQDNKHNMPSEMEILFDSRGNITNLRLWIHDKIQYHFFQGDAQYIPPELSSRRAYHCDLVDVWVLGISLYRMLVGKYPFHANNDRRLFNKMQYADFGIPSHLSADAKDLLRRMLAPEHSRASLDLVMFHPWLKPYTVVLPAIDNNNRIKSPGSTPSPRVGPHPPPAPPPHAWHQYHKHGKKSSLSSHFQKVMVLIVQGPYPPPKQPYRDLAPTV